MALGPIGSLAASARATLVRRDAEPPVPTRPGTVLVLSGGAALGAAQAGMVRVLLDAGIVPDAVVGVSAGAINGAHVAFHPTPEAGEQLEDLWRSLSTYGVIGGRGSWAWNVLRLRTGAFPAEGLRHELEEAVGEHSDVADSPTELHIGTTHLASGDPVFHTSGPLVDVLLASSALPGLFPAVDLPDPSGRHAGLHVDGAVTAILPITYALALEPRHVWVLDVSGAVRATAAYHPGSLDLVSNGFALALKRQVGLGDAGHDPRVTCISLRMRPAAKLRSVLDFDHTEDLIEAGRREAEEGLAHAFALRPDLIPGSAARSHGDRTA
ncbi:MAG: patatin-like phospholipase family protein [Actinobacteria bacterium]|jgi:NTE family protein|nr:patatin-like phospholipase family protein [Actinomycetota bacterium]